MKTYYVQIRATIRKTITVQAENEKEAVELAHQEFTTEPDNEEVYDEETLNVMEAES